MACMQKQNATSDERMHATAKDRDLCAIQENYRVYMQNRAKM